MEERNNVFSLAGPVIIYGAGAVANFTYLFMMLHGEGDRVKCFVVTKMDNNPWSKYGKPVIEWKEYIKNRSPDDLLVVAVQNEAQEEIVGTVKKDGIYNYIKINADTIVDNFYDRLYKNPICKNKIVFSNMKGLGYGGNPKYIAQKLLEVDWDKRLELVWCTYDKSSDMPKGIRQVEYGSMEYYHDMATAAVWVDNARKDSDIHKRAGQIYIQTWHGAAPFKKVEKDVPQSLTATYMKNAVNDSKMADLFLSGSRFYSELYRRSFWYDGEIMETGLPRQDLLFHPAGAKDKIFMKYGIGKDTLFVLYAPTFRDACCMDVYDLDFEMCQSAIEKRFQRKVVFGISKHPSLRNYSYQFAYDKIHVDVSRHEDFEEVLAAADIMISDYSGCIYDFSFLRRPIFLYQPDYETYIRERGFYFSMKELPYPTAGSNQELAEIIRSFDLAAFQKGLDIFMERLGNFDRGNASRSVAEWILKRLQGDR